MERSKVITVIITLLFAFLIGRLWHLQLVRGESFQRLAERNRIRTVPIRAPRGSIYDRTGNLLAENRLAFTVSVVPSGFHDPEGTILSFLAELLEVSEDELQQSLARGGGRPYEPIRLKRDIPIEKVVAIEENRSLLPGIFVEEEWVRRYPRDELAGHILGYLGLADARDIEAGYSPSDLVGKSGLEQTYERFLRGKDGVRRVEVNALNRPVQELGVVLPEPGLDLRLSLDLELQEVAAHALQSGLIQATDAMDVGTIAGSGAVVVFDPRTGDILAMASYPGLSPARISGEGRAQYVLELNQSPQSPWLNRSLRAFPPGSIFKVVTAIAALESNAIGPDTVYHADGRHKYGKADWTIHSGLPPAGPVTIVEAMGRSTNDFFWEIALRPQTGGVEGLAHWARRFGLGSRTGLDLNGAAEMAGLVPDPEWKRTTLRQPWYEAETMDVAIGQGFVTTTPLQIARLYGAIATKGELRKPRLVLGASSPDGTVSFEVEPEVVEHITLRSSTWQALHDGLRSVVQWPRGTAYRAFEGIQYDAAGKTGSAQTGQEAHGWFAGFAPADNPELVVVVFAEYGGGGAQAARIARSIFDHYFGGPEEGSEESPE